MSVPAEQLTALTDRLGSLGPEQKVRLACTVSLMGLVLALFHFRGNSEEIAAFGTSALNWLRHRWTGVGGDFSYAWAIPFVTAWLVWRRRQELWDVEKKTDTLGLVLVAGCLMLHLLGYRAQQVRLSLLAMFGLFWTIPFYLYGRRAAGLLLFPCVYSLFCIPLSFLNSISFPLRLFASQVGAVVLNALGIEVIRSGTRIFEIVRSADGAISQTAEGFKFNVADPCSGLHSLIAMMALASAYAYVTQKTVLKKWILFLGGIPLAIAGNIARILTIFIVAAVFGQDIASRLYHDYSGFILFPVAILLMIAFGNLLNMRYAEVWAQCRSKLLTPSSSSSDS